MTHLGLLSEQPELFDWVDHWTKTLRDHPHLGPAIPDFETRSACDLNKQGAYIYSRHSTTQAMSLSYVLPGVGRPSRWHMAHPQHLIDESPPPLDLFAFILAGGRLEAHNAFFERVIWGNIMVSRHGWPEVPESSWRCSAAKACAMSLPRDLEGAAIAMDLAVEKDMEGHALMKKMSRPRKPLKAEREAWRKEHGEVAMPLLWHEEEKDIYRLWEYNDNDVVTQKALGESIPDLSERELRIWQMDQRMNMYGARFDLDMAESALKLSDDYKRRLNSELEFRTGIERGSQRQAVKDWLAVNEDVELSDTRADTVDWVLKHEEVSPRAERVLTILREVNRTSTSKYSAMLRYAAPEDWRIRDLLMYHGAGTGRWAGRGVQVHNFPARNLIVKDFEDAAECVLSGDLDWCRAMYGDPLKLLSHALRGTIIPEDGNDLMVADYSAIEARCVLWEAEATKALEIFRKGGDIYCDMATGIYGYEVLKDVHIKERQFGKQSILGLGYGMGFITFLIMCRGYQIEFSRKQVLNIMGVEELKRMEQWVRKYLGIGFIPGDTVSSSAKRQAAIARRRLRDERMDPEAVVHELALMKHTVNVYRTRYPEVKELWNDQESGAIRAVQTGERVRCGKVTWFTENDFLRCELPSKRLMSYRKPLVKTKKTSWGELRPHLSYMSVNGVTRQWERTGTYGGKLVENITQAVARDIMADAMLLADEGGKYHTTMSVHDELVCEVRKNEGSLEEFERLMSATESWARGCPITAEAKRLSRYEK